MMKHAARSLLLLLVVTFTFGPLVGSAQETTVASTQIATDVRKHLLSLPYCGAFDLLTFNVDNSDVVTIAGYVLADSFKKDAEREAREAKGVKEVPNKIAVHAAEPERQNKNNYPAWSGQTANIGHCARRSSSGGEL